MAARSLLLVHGAGSGPWIFDGWDAGFEGLDVRALDLQAGLVVARSSMLNYAAAVAAAAQLLEPPVAICGWSMGGLAAMMAAERAGARALVLLEPSPPAQVQGVDEQVELLEGTFDPEAVYGPFPPGVPGRPESSLARAERKRGISVPSLPCPTLAVFGRTFGAERGRDLARVYGAAEAELPAADHWDLVRDELVRPGIAAFLDGDDIREL